MQKYHNLFKVGDEFHKKASKDICFQMFALFIYYLLVYVIIKIVSMKFVFF